MQLLALELRKPLRLLTFLSCFPDSRKLVLTLLALGLLNFAAPDLTAQSPNTASMIVFVVDQAGAVVKDAKVVVVNSATGAERDVVSGSDGNATIPALSL